MNIELVIRPARVGWCVRAGDLEDLRAAIRLSHCLWGGRFNPILPIGAGKLPARLVDLFSVEVLYPLANDPAIDEFLAHHSHLPWPMIEKDIVRHHQKGHSYTTLLDVSHPLYLLKDRIGSSPVLPRLRPVIHDDDPLADVLLATYGDFPQDATGSDYRQGYAQLLDADDFDLPNHAAIPLIMLEAITPNIVTTAELEWRPPTRRMYPGVYNGNADNFLDIVTYWNLRAAGAELLFYDSRHADRLRSLLQAHVEKMRAALVERDQDDRYLSLWNPTNPGDKELTVLSGPWASFTVSEATWNGLNLQPVTLELTREMVFGMEVTKASSPPSVEFQVQRKRWLRESRRSFRQHCVFSVRPLLTSPENAEFTYAPFNIPELNKHYGRNMLFGPNKARLGRSGMAVVDRVTTTHFTLHALRVHDLIEETFRQLGMAVQVSQAGLIAQRLVRQMGGLQGCRVFKIRGVRKLIASHSPLSSFSRSKALQIIGDLDPVTNRPRFQDYENLYLETRTKQKLNPDDAFRYLLSKHVFRVGLDLTCPFCRLEFWQSIDDVTTLPRCQYCGEIFNVMPQLRDRDWRFRRSGLFGREDHQQGAIPVALVLQQLDSTLDAENYVYSAGLAIAPQGAAVQPCESDFVLLLQEHNGSVNIAIGECKTADEISDQDVRNLATIADVFERGHVESYIIFAKTGEFTPPEIDRCKNAQSRHRVRVILLGPRELEPDLAFGENVTDYAGSLRDMAEITARSHFEAKAPAELSEQPQSH